MFNKRLQTMCQNFDGPLCSCGFVAVAGWLVDKSTRGAVAAIRYYSPTDARRFSDYLEYQTNWIGVDTVANIRIGVE